MKIPLHTPYKNGKGGVKVGLEPVDELKWIEIDELFSSEIAQKKNLYKTKHQDVYQETPDSFESQEEFLNLLREHLLEYYPEHLIQNESKRNRDTSPLEIASLLVQEDLVLMLPQKEEYFLGAASLCAPSNWSLKEKFNKSLLMLHKDVPSYSSKIGSRVNNIFINLPEEKIFQRFNWSIYETPILFQPAESKSYIERSKQINQENAGDKLFIRVERQTIRRLPITQSIIFTIRVHVDPLNSIKKDISLLQDLKKAIVNLDVSMKEYKSINQINQPLIDWLSFQERSLS